MKLSNLLAPVLLLSVTTLTACGGGGDSGGDTGGGNTTPTPDTTAPVITVNGESTLTHSAGTTYVDAGASANDAKDGAVSVTSSGSVDSDLVSSYTITYAATDAAGNTSSLTRTVNVVDDVAPVITLQGSSEVTHSAGTDYIDAGATAEDGVDGTVDVVTTGAVDTTRVGEYTLTYTATDAAGNISTTTRVVNVVDDIAPVLVLNGVTPVAHNAGDAYTDLGAVVTDNLDEASAITITTESLVNADVIGSYTVTYTAQDAAGNAATPVVRIVNVADLAPPVITLNGDAEITHNYGDAYTDQGVTATDNVDTTVTVIITGGVTTDMINSYTITYTATDEAGNEALPVVRTVTVADIAGPVITLNGESTITLGQERLYKELGASAIDNVDGEMTLGAPTGTIDNTTIGQNTLTYSITDAAGNTSTLERTIEVVAPRPFITTWKTDNPGVSADDTIKITTDSSTHSGTYNYSVDWGDGDITNETGDATHTYASAGTYTVTINGDFPQTYFEYGLVDDSRKLLTIEQWGDIEWLSMFQGFLDCSILELNAIDAPLLYKATDSSYMFQGAIVLNQNLNHWDVSTITTMENMFASAAAFNGDISSWDVSSVTLMPGMFGGGAAFNQDISSWDVSSVTDMEYMFIEAYAFNQDISTWDVSSVNNMLGIFEDITLSTANYDALLIGWSMQILQTGVTFDGGHSQFSPSSQTARDIFTSTPNNWTITDGGVIP